MLDVTAIHRINLLLLLTAVTLLTDGRDVALLAERPAVVAVYAAVVHVEESAAGDALEVFRVPGLTQGFDRVLENHFTGTTLSAGLSSR